jgi:hypothetical protein
VGAGFSLIPHHLGKGDAYTSSIQIWGCSTRFSQRWRTGAAIPNAKGGLNSKLRAVCDENGRPLVMLLSDGKMSDYKGAVLVLSGMPKR